MTPSEPETSEPTSTQEVGAHARRLAWALFTVSAAQFVLQLDFSIVNVALPTIQRELHFAPANLQWLVTGYALTFGSLLLLGGRIGDAAGHRRLLIIGLALFGVTSLAAGLAPTAPLLVLARFAQGASAAMVAPQALATISDLYTQGPSRIRALGMFQGATAAGASAGIVLGGILTQYVGWRSIFLVNPPIALALIFLVARSLPQSLGTSHTRLDATGAVLVTISIASLIFGLSRGQQHGFTSPLALASFVVTALLGAGFVVVEGRVTAPLVPFKVFADPTRRAALTVMVLMGAIIAGYVYFTSLYLQRVLDFSALETGFALIPSTLTAMVTSMFVARRLLARFEVRTILVVGLSSTGLGQVWLFYVSAHGTYAANVLAGLILTAFGLGVTFPTAAVAVTSGMSAGDRGLGGGLYATALQVGQAVGLASLATVAAARTAVAHKSLVSGYKLSYLVAAGLVIVAVGTVLLQLRPRGAAIDDPETA